METLTTVLAVFGEMVACVALGWEMRAIAELKHQMREDKRREMMKGTKNEKYSNSSSDSNSF
jgi:hypothetical protein